MRRREFLRTLATLVASHRLVRATTTTGQRLADAARAQVGVTTGYDPAWTSIPYPGGDVPRTTGVCADIIIRATRDGLGLDLQKLVHEDIMKHSTPIPCRKIGRKHALTQTSTIGGC
jgi:hypothetical protein